MVDIRAIEKFLDDIEDEGSTGDSNLLSSVRDRLKPQIEKAPKRSHSPKIDMTQQTEAKVVPILSSGEEGVVFAQTSQPSDSSVTARRDQPLIEFIPVTPQKSSSKATVVQVVKPAPKATVAVAKPAQKGREDIAFEKPVKKHKAPVAPVKKETPTAVSQPQKEQGRAVRPLPKPRPAPQPKPVPKKHVHDNTAQTEADALIGEAFEQKPAPVEAPKPMPQPAPRPESKPAPQELKKPQPKPIPKPATPAKPEARPKPKPIPQPIQEKEPAPKKPLAKPIPKSVSAPEKTVPAEQKTPTPTWHSSPPPKEEEKRGLFKKKEKPVELEARDAPKRGTGWDTDITPKSKDELIKLKKKKK
ncbi:MAG: hypothetical protein QCI38_02640 [Candidatus Thermoplasmatota archaeon]|nr:hypothetical protein [Candidatus Thermoplasmatota archaeon]